MTNKHGSLPVTEVDDELIQRRKARDKLTREVQHLSAAQDILAKYGFPSAARQVETAIGMLLRRLADAWDGGEQKRS